MSRNKRLMVDRILADRLGGREKLRALLINASGSIQQWSRSHGFYPEQVTMTLSGAREYPEVRAEIAAFLGITREEVDGLIGPPANVVEIERS